MLFSSIAVFFLAPFSHDSFNLLSRLITDSMDLGIRVLSSVDLYDLI